MAYFDYSRPEVNDASEGIRRIGDALSQTLERRRKQQEFAKTQEFQREQEDRKFTQSENQLKYQNRTQDAREKRDEFDFVQKQQKFRGEQTRAVQKALADGNPQLAAALAQETTLFDPKTGSASHGKLTAGPVRDVGPAPQEPPLPLAKPDPVEFGPVVPPEIAARRRGMKAPEPEKDALVGPIPSAEERRHAEIQRIGTQPPSLNVPDVEGQLAAAEAERQGQIEQRGRFEAQSRGFRAEAEQATAEEQAKLDQHSTELHAAERDQARFRERSAGLPVARAQHTADERRAENERTYSLQFGDEPPVQLDVQTQRYASREAAANDFLSSLPQGLSPQDQAAARNAHAAILSGDDPQKAIAAYNKERAGIATRDLTQSEGAARDKNRIDVAHINARKPGLVLQERRFAAGQDKDRRKETRGDIEHWLKASGLETAPKALAALDQSLKQLKGNAPEQQAALVGMARATQGDNRFSDADYKVFVQNGGIGTLDQIAQTFQRIENGEFGEERIAVATKMGRALKAVFEQRLRSAAEDAREEFVQNEIYDPAVAESVLEQRLGKGFYQRQGPRRGGPPEVNARRQGAAGTSKTVKAEGLTNEQLLEALKAAQ